MRWETVIFDLDGTLTDSAPGIVNAVRYALEKMGLREEDGGDLRRFVGPPLHETLCQVYGLDYEAGWRALDHFRTYYVDKGWLENAVYPGIPELLRDLQAAGKTLLVATSKPDEQARRVLDYFELTQYFSCIEGASLDETHCQKAEVMRKVLKNCPHRTPVVMVGDRENDCRGAAENGIPAIGALYGYGSREELESAGADRIAETVEDLRAILLGEN